jgi:hypothetical protein
MMPVPITMAVPVAAMTVPMATMMTVPVATMMTAMTVTGERRHWKQQSSG